MYIDPRTAIAKGWITGITNPETQVQPNAIDFTLDKVYRINDKSTFIITESGKRMRGGDELLAIPSRKQNSDKWLWHLDGNSVYDGMSDIMVDLPEGVACELIIRSTFNRNGLFLTSGLYDSGFKGHIGFAIHNRSGKAIIGTHTRIGQIKFVAAETSGMYVGGYNHAGGDYRDHCEQHVDRMGGELHSGEES